MPFKSETYRVLIASPSDLTEERQAATDAVDDWNAQHAVAESVVLLPVKWETYATPQTGVRPQEAINNQLVRGCDILVGMFWTKIGTNTGVAESGTVEEIDLFVAFGKPALLYFSSRPIDPNKIDLKQHKKLRRFKDATYKMALTGRFSTVDELRQTLLRDLMRQVRQLKTSKPIRSGEPDQAPAITELDPTHRQHKLLTPSRMAARLAGVSATATKPTPREFVIKDRDSSTHKKSPSGALSVEAQCWPIWRDAFPASRAPGESLEAMLYREAQGSIKFMTISGRSIYDGDVEEALASKPSTFTMKLLLFDWNSSHFLAKMRDERRKTKTDIELARHKASDIARSFLNLADDHDINVQIKLYKEYPVWRMIIVDENRAHVGYYPPGKRGYEGPLFLFDADARAGLFYPVNRQFDVLWSRSGEPLARRDQRLRVRPIDMGMRHL